MNLSAGILPSFRQEQAKMVSQAIVSGLSMMFQLDLELENMCKIVIKVC